MFMTDLVLKYSFNGMFNFVWKARRKDKEPSAVTAHEESKQYLQASMLECTTPEVKLREVVNLPEGVDYNEWLASHTLAFFDHINLLYGTISEFCSMSGCPDMTGPCNRQYFWIDEKGKRIKLPAPQYVDYVMTFTQKTVNDESLFPTKFDKEFPSSFEMTVKKILRLLFHVLAHIYSSHFKEIVLLNLHSHLNCIFAHLVLFNDKFKMIEMKEIEVLQDLAVAMRLFPPNESTTPGVDITSVTDHHHLVGDHHFSGGILNNNNGEPPVITQQCRSISPLMEQANSKCLVGGHGTPVQAGNHHHHRHQQHLAAFQMHPKWHPKWLIDPKLCSVGPQISSKDHHQATANAGGTTTIATAGLPATPNRRSISASAILLSSSDPAIPASLSRRCNSDRSAGCSTSSTIYHGSVYGMNVANPAINAAPIFAACADSTAFKF